MKPPVNIVIGDNTFYIYHFSAFTAANISGDLTAILTPILVSVAPAIVGSLNFGGDSTDGDSIFDTDLSAATPSLMKAFASLDGETLEKLLRKLLVKHRNISYENNQEKVVRWLESDSVDELFTGELADMLTLAVEVLKVNFSGFFKKLGSQYGVQMEAVMSKVGFKKTTDTSTEADSPTSN